MWLLIPVIAFLLLSYVGRQVRLGKLRLGPLFRRFRAARSLLSLVLFALSVFLGMKGMLWPSVVCLIASIVLGSSLRFGGTTGPATAASYSAEEIRAYQTLGLSIGADRKAVKEAWKKLMKAAHPDQGGTTSRASALNAARDVLLRRW